MNQTEDMNTPEKTYLTEHEFISRISELIPAPNAETNHNLLDLANGLWFEMKDDLYHAFSFVSRQKVIKILHAGPRSGTVVCGNVIPACNRSVVHDSRAGKNAL